MARVLLIDRDTHQTELVQLQLAKQGFEVIIARLGEEGVKEALKSKPDLILLDAYMPDATGFQLCKWFRQNETTKSTPIIMMSSLAQFPNQQQFASERGANEYISKPVQVVELGEMVDRYIGSQSRPSVSTRVHQAMREWLGKALTKDDKSSIPPPDGSSL